MLHSFWATPYTGFTFTWRLLRTSRNRGPMAFCTLQDTRHEDLNVHRRIRWGGGGGGGRQTVHSCNNDNKNPKLVKQAKIKVISDICISYSYLLFFCLSNYLPSVSLVGYHTPLPPRCWNCPDRFELRRRGGGGGVGGTLCPLSKRTCQTSKGGKIQVISVIFLSYSSSFLFLVKLFVQ